MKLDAKKFFLILVGVNVLLAAATLGVFVVASSVAQKKSDKIAQLKADEQTNEQALNYYKVLQSNLDANQDLLKIADKVLPSDKDQSVAFADLDKISKNTGVPIQQITFNPGTNKGSGQTLTSPGAIKGVSVISVTLQIQGTKYENMVAFLKAIENTQRRMQTASLNITPNPTNPSVLDRVDLSLDIYLKAGK